MIEDVKDKHLLMVGAGGIGCELLKNLVLSGFRNIDIVDMDTIDVSNLNRQFLFHKKHVGRPKAEVARESAEALNPDAKIRHYTQRIQDSIFNKRFFQDHDLVINALDNIAARSHVNRMCLSANVPLIESGSAGYLGQVSVIRKGWSECYDCTPKARPKTFPGCTIRNTPSEPVHCVVWAKHLFNQLFGEVDIDDDVSPDLSDPELAGEGQGATNGSVENGTASGFSTRTWAHEHGYKPSALFDKLFLEDIKYLLRLENLWKERTPPTPLSWESLDAGSSTSTQNGSVSQREVWTIAQCRDVFAASVQQLYERFKQLSDGKVLVWDKDDDTCMDFVASCANIRSQVFKIKLLSRFDLKAVAGNIIPAIATTNAVIAGLITVEAVKVLRGQWDIVHCTAIREKCAARGRLFNVEQVGPPNPSCYVCAPHPEITVSLDTDTTKVKELVELVLKGRLGMVSPDAELMGAGKVVVSSDPEEMEDLKEKTLSELGIVDGVQLGCDDFHQDFFIKVNIVHSDSLDKDTPFLVLDDSTETAPVGNNGPDSKANDGVVLATKRKAVSDDAEVEVKKPKVQE